jgi:hypothetical protein
MNAPESAAWKLRRNTISAAVGLRRGGMVASLLEVLASVIVEDDIGQRGRGARQTVTLDECLIRESPGSYEQRGNERVRKNPSDHPVTSRSSLSNSGYRMPGPA